jgi:hypothetical protein
MRSSLNAAAMLILVAASVAGQELEPRAYSPSPVGTTFVLTGVGRSEGGILLDPSLDVDNVRADLWIATPGFGYTFGLAGRQARLLAIFPIAWGRVAGDVGLQQQHQDLAGLADPRIKLSVGLLGAPAQTVEEFAWSPRRLALGASVTMMPPLGQYNSEQLVNLGYNRWGFKPEVGLSYPAGRWTIDSSVGCWFFTTNESYYPGNARKEQDAVFALQGHVSYALPRRAWLAVNGTWFAGGETRVDRALNPDEQRNARLGATLSIPIARQQSLKFIYSTGTTTRRGSDFDTFNVTWQLVSFTRRAS